MKARACVLDGGGQSQFTRKLMRAVAAMAALLAATQTASAQVPARAPLPVLTPPPPASAPSGTRYDAYDAAELERIVSPIALYPDPLLAQVLSAAAFPSQVSAAMQWVDVRRGLNGQQLVEALAEEQVPWDPSVQALVAFPTVLQMMASAMPWTSEIGDAFQQQHGEVMDAVQRLRAQAQRYGYLQSTPQYRVSRAPVIEIVPVNPEYVVVPYYDPIIVFAPPRPHYVVSTAIYFGYGVRLGEWYEPWGWRTSGFYWPDHRVVNVYPGWNRPWNYRESGRGYGYASPRREEHAVTSPRGYTDPRYTNPRYTDPRYTDRGNSNRGRQNNEGDRAGAPSSGNGRTAQPRSGHDMQQAGAGREVLPGAAREAPRSGGQQAAPRQNGDGGSHDGGSRDGGSRGERIAKARTP